LTKLGNTIYNTGEWPQDFTEVTMIALKKKTKAAKCSDYRTISLIAHTAKIIALDLSFDRLLMMMMTATSTFLGQSLVNSGTEDGHIMLFNTYTSFKKISIAEAILSVS